MSTSCFSKFPRPSLSTMLGILSPTFTSGIFSEFNDDADVDKKKAVTGRELWGRAKVDLDNNNAKGKPRRRNIIVILWEAIFVGFVWDAVV